MKFYESQKKLHEPFSRVFTHIELFFELSTRLHLSDSVKEMHAIYLNAFPLHADLITIEL